VVLAHSVVRPLSKEVTARQLSLFCVEVTLANTQFVVREESRRVRTLECAVECVEGVERP